MTPSEATPAANKLIADALAIVCLRFRGMFYGGWLSGRILEQSVN